MDFTVSEAIRARALLDDLQALAQTHQSPQVQARRAAVQAELNEMTGRGVPLLSRGELDRIAAGGALY